MLSTVVALAKKHQDILSYLFFGVCTTVVNVVVYALCSHVLALGTVVSSCFAWFIAVAFAYITNRKWVFHSEATTTRAILREILDFFGCRLATGVLEVGFMWLTVDVFALDDLVMKVLSTILVIVANYVASKLYIFRAK